MNDRHTADTITDDALDALYEQLAAAEESAAQRELATAREALASATSRAARAEADLKTLGQTALGYQQRAWDAEAELKQAQAALDRVRHLADLIDTGAPWTSNQQTTAARIREAAASRPAGGHLYLSTGCRHGDHAYCQNHTGLSGQKTPATCKFCGAPCICGCHQPAHNAGPTVAECAEADRRWWGSQKAGE